MSRVRPLPRNVQTLIEPGEPEKLILRTIMANIQGFASDPTQLRNDVRQFSTEIGIALSDLPEGLSRWATTTIDPSPLDVATNLASIVSQRVHAGLAGYINERPDLRPIDRKKAVMDFMKTRQDFDQEDVSYEALAPDQKSMLHLKQALKFSSTLIQAYIVMTLSGVDDETVRRQKGNIPGVGADIVTATESDMFTYPLQERPYFSGIAYMHFRIEGAFQRYMYALDGKCTSEIDTLVAGHMAERQQGLIQCIATPERFHQMAPALRAMQYWSPAPGKAH